MNVRYRNSLILLIISVLSIGNVFANNNRMKKNVSILNGKPVFTLRIENSAAAFSVVLNGVRVQRELNASYFNVDLPVNHYLTSGLNKLQLYSFLNIEDNKVIADSGTKIYLKVNDYESDETFIIATIASTTKGFEIGDSSLGSTSDVRLNSLRSFFPDENGDVEIRKLKVERPKNDPKLIKYDLEFVIHSSIPRWKFLDSTSLKFVDDMTDIEWNEHRDELASIYRTIQQAVISGNIDQIMPMFRERNEELDAAFYYEPGRMEKQLRSSFIDASNDKGLEATSMSNSELGYVNTYSGQLSRLIRSSRHPAITFNFKDAMGSQSYDIWFRKEGDKWVISR